MPRKMLTDRALKALKPALDGKPYDVMDAAVPGLGVRVLAGGRRSFILVGRFPGSRNPTRRALGEYGALTLDAARQRARNWLDLIRAGRDPAEHEASQRRAEAFRRDNTFGAIAEDFIQLAVLGPDRNNPKQRKGLEVERDLRKEFIGRWEKRPITEITAHDVLEVLDAAVSRGSPYQAHNLLGHVRRLFNWAIARGIYGLERSPCDRMKPKDVIGKKALRTRTLTVDELRAFWRSSRRLGYPFGPLLQLLAVTGQRKSEVGDARWSEFHPELDRLIRAHAKSGKPIRWASVNSEWKLWTVPAERMKAGTAHAVPLSDEALGILATLPRFKKGDYLFSTTFGEKPVNGYSKAKIRVDRQMLLTLRAMARARGDDPERVSLEPFVFHDVRRTMRTHLSMLPIPDMVRELVIAHTKPGLHKVYDQHAYLEEKRHALDMWAGRLRDLVLPAPRNVVRLHAAS